MRHIDEHTNDLTAKAPQIISAGDGELITLPHADFISQSELLREGQDLMLEGPEGTVIIIEGYFNAVPAPTLQSPDGQALSPQMVDSFVQTAGPLQYADAGSMTDVSPVGAAQEVTGKATVIRVDGSSEALMIGTPIFEGDVIETEADGAVNLVFMDETSLAVSNNAKLSIDEYVFDPSSEGGASDFSILRGLFVFTSGLIGRDDPDDVHINTPMGSIGIRGTIIAGNADTGEITVMEGAIVLRNFNGFEMTLAEQFQTARFDTANGEIVAMGNVSPDNFIDNFSGMKTVVPTFFATLETKAGDEVNMQEAPKQQQEMHDPAQEATLEQSMLPADIPPPEAVFADTTFGGTDAGFALSSQTEGDIMLEPVLLDPALGNNGLLPALNTSLVNLDPVQQDTAQILPILGTATGTETGNAAPVVIDLRTISGADGYRILGNSAENFGYSVAAIGDTDLDGFDNFIVSNSLAISAQAFGYNGVSTTSYAGIVVGASDTSMADLSTAGDFNGDGTLDFITGTPNSSGQGNIFIAGTATFFNAGVAAGDLAGRDVDGLGDVNGDGYSDVILGVPGSDYSTGPDDGAAIILLGNAAATAQDASALSSGVRIDNITDNEMFGINVSGMGDFDNDGFADFMVAKLTGSNTASVEMYFGDSATAMYDNIADSVYSITNIGTDGNDVPLFNMGDLNGDSVTDIAIADTLNNELHIMYGGTTPDNDLSDGVNNNGYTIYNSGAGSLDGGGYGGDFNGDGFNDGVVVIRNGTVADIFVIYGSSTSPAGNVIDVQDLYGDTAGTFHMVYTVGHNGSFDFTVTSVGDLDGDGFDDIAFGTSDAGSGDGAVSVVFGRNDTHTGSEGDMVHVAGQTTALDDVIANANNQHLVGSAADNILDDNSQNGISMRGGAGDDILQINSDNFRTIDGGTGIDKLEIFSANNLDFASFGSEALSGIEKFALMEDSQTITLGMDDIFRLLQESQDVMTFAGPENRKVLKIADIFEYLNGSDSDGTTLNIDNNITGGGSIVGSGFTAGGTITDAGITYDVYDFGGTNGYALLIDQNIENVNVI